MSNRTSADIALTPAPALDTTIYVPITRDSRRVFHLMKDDYIRIKWFDNVAHHFGIGSIAHDELFGYFYVTEEQFPTFDQNTGAYVYDIRFDREYIGWKNLLYMLTYTDNNVVTRRETEWTLTDTLRNHMQEFQRNLGALGYSDYEVSINSDYVDINASISVSFSGTSLFDALNTYADAWKCEWWITYDDTSSVYVINFGKCEIPSSVSPIVTLSVGTNVESLTAQKSQGEYANKVYAYGSTKNIPDTYRKDLIFKVTDTDTRADTYNFTGSSVTVYRDAIRVVERRMLAHSVYDAYNLNISNITKRWASSGLSRWCNGLSSSGTFVAPVDMVADPSGYLQIAIKVSEKGNYDYGLPPINWSVSINNHTYASGTITTYDILGGTTTITTTFSDTVPLPAGNVPWSFMIDASSTAQERYVGIDEYHIYSKEITLTPSGYTIPATLITGGNSYPIEFNPLSYKFTTREVFNWFAFTNTSPSGFGVNSEYTIGISDGTTNGLLITKIPTSFYTDEYGEPGSLKLIGERRLMLPKTHGTPPISIPGYLPVNPPTTHLLVEKVVIFEEDYPKCALQITDLEKGTYNADVQYADGSKTIGSLPKYTIEAKRITSSGLEPFAFSDEYLTSETLQIKFLTPDEAEGYDPDYATRYPNATYKLSGMTFGVHFNQNAQSYEIAWNSDYGAMLPNDTLCPALTDPFILIGWNTKAMQSLGLIETAENQLYDDTEAWLAAASKPQFTYTANMMSDVMKARCDTDGIDGLFAPGQKVTISEFGTTQTTRVIGYELKLDIPYDTPQYEIGETETYSRLRALEKKLNAQTQSVTASSGSVSAISGGGSSSGGSSGTTSQSLSWQTGSMDGFFADSFNGSDAKSIVVPSTFAHLTEHPTDLQGYGITDAVNTTGAQTVGGAKTFTSAIAATGGIGVADSIYPFNDDSVYLGGSSLRWRSVNTKTLGVNRIYLAQDDTSGNNIGVISVFQDTGNNPYRQFTLSLGLNSYIFTDTWSGFFYQGGTGILGNAYNPWASAYITELYLDENTKLYKDAGGNWHITDTRSGHSINLIVDGDIACG